MPQAEEKLAVLAGPSVAPPIPVPARVVTVKFFIRILLADVEDWPFTVTRIFPVVAPLGTTTVSKVFAAEVTVAETLLIVTWFEAGSALKFDPAIVRG